MSVTSQPTTMRVSVSYQGIHRSTGQSPVQNRNTPSPIQEKDWGTSPRSEKEAIDACQQGFDEAYRSKPSRRQYTQIRTKGQNDAQRAYDNFPPSTKRNNMRKINESEQEKNQLSHIVKDMKSLDKLDLRHDNIISNFNFRSVSSSLQNIEEYSQYGSMKDGVENVGKRWKKARIKFVFKAADTIKNLYSDIASKDIIEGQTYLNKMNQVSRLRTAIHDCCSSLKEDGMSSEEAEVLLKTLSDTHLDGVAQYMKDRDICNGIAQTIDECYIDQIAAGQIDMNKYRENYDPDYRAQAPQPTYNESDSEDSDDEISGDLLQGPDPRVQTANVLNGAQEEKTDSSDEEAIADSAVHWEAASSEYSSDDAAVADSAVHWEAASSEYSSDDAAVADSAAHWEAASSEYSSNDEAVPDPVLQAQEDMTARANALSGMYLRRRDSGLDRYLTDDED